MSHNLSGYKIILWKFVIHIYSLKVKGNSHEQLPIEGGRLISLRKDCTQTKTRKEEDVSASLTNTQGESSGLSRGRTRSAKRSRSPDSWTQAERSIPEKQKVCPLLCLLDSPKIYSWFCVSTWMPFFSSSDFLAEAFVPFTHQCHPETITISR